MLPGASLPLRSSGRPAATQPQQQLRWCRVAAAASSRCSRGRRRLTTVAYRRQPAAPAAQQVPDDQRQGPTVLLPLDFYACLGVTRTAAGRAVRDALDRALIKRPEAYFSADTVALRDLLLRNAAECLLNYDKRRDYDARSSVSGFVVSVSEDHLPGALVLLQESGCNQLVLDLGAQWLAVNRQDVRRRDVMAAMALAHRALALQGLQQESSSCMLEACRHLESALSLIRQSIHGSEHAAAAADLQRDVMQLLKDFSPDYCLALLALPLDDPQRQRGHVLLRKLLWELPDDLSPLGGDKEEFLAAARSLLTPQEHLDIHKSAPKGPHSFAQQQLLAEAAVAVAFQRKQPLLLLQAASAFEKLEQAAAAAQETPVDMCVERACIALLLGNTDKALQALGLAADERHKGGSNPTQQAAQQYVLAHCADRSDLLPGMYALAQCWMQQGMLGSFRQASGAVAADQQQQQPRGELDLAPWFDSLLVRLVILVFAMTCKLQQCVQAVLGAPAAVLASLVWLQKRLLAGKQAGVASSKAATSSASPQAHGSTTAATSSSSNSRGASRGASSSTPVERVASQQHTTQGRQAASTRGGTAVEHADAQQTAAAATTTPSRKQPQQPQRRQRQQAVQQQQPGLGSSMPSAAQAVQQSSQTNASSKAPAAVQPDGSPSYKPAGAAAAAAVDEQPSLMARARAAAGRGSSGMQRAGSSMEEEDGDQPGPSPLARKRLGRQMSALEVQMWDTTPEPAGWRAVASKVASVLLVGAALVVVVGSSRQQQGAGNTAPNQLGGTLLFDARG